MFELVLKWKFGSFVLEFKYILGRKNENNELLNFSIGI